MHTNPSSMINAFTDRHILVIGEAILDSYLTGSANRLCAEAPVPVVTLNDRQDIPGGAANTAVNLRSLGAHVSLLSVIGDDSEGVRLQQALERQAVATETLVVQPDRRTLAKHRVMADAQMVVRLDQGSTSAIASNSEEQLIHHLNHLFSQCDAVIISDYGYGILTPRVIQAIAQLQSHSPRLLVADGKRLVAYQTIGVTVVKPNYEEAIRLLATTGIDATSNDEGVTSRVDRIGRYREQLLDVTGATVVAVTLDVDGALILQRDCPPYRLQAKATACSNTTGAGDTFVSALTLALTAGATVTVAAELAVAAAAVVVVKEGTASCSAKELQTMMTMETSPRSDWWQESLSRNTIAERDQTAKKEVA